MNASFLFLSRRPRDLHPRWMPRLGVIATMMFSLAGCNGVNLGLGIQGGGNEELATAVNSSSADYVVLDLNSGKTTPQAEVTDLATNALYRTSQMVFRRVHGMGDDYLLGVFEVTQAQWVKIAGIQTGTVPPWDATVIASSLVGGSEAIGDSRPAFNLSYSSIETTLTTFNSGKTVRMAVPSSDEWQFACAAGSTGPWSWGDDSSYTTLFDHAVVAETQGDTASTKGPQSVGGRHPNAFGLYDMHGNVWEWESSGTTIMGGSWHDSYLQSRTANRAGFLDASIVDTTAHALIGVRLKLLL